MKTRNMGLIFSGSIILLIGLAHTIFPAYGYSDDVQKYFKQSPQIADHFNLRGELFKLEKISVGEELRQDRDFRDLGLDFEYQLFYVDSYASFK